MKNFKLNKGSLITILGGALLCIVFASCKNFLNATQIKDEIEAAIAKNNAKDIVVQIESKDMGIITPNGSVTRKLGYEFEVQFRPDTEKYFLQDVENIFEAVSIYDDTQSFNEYVQFTTLAQNDEDKANGIYRVDVKVLEDIKGILIKPKCTELPKVVEVFPPNNVIDYRQDISLEVKFNKAIKLEDFVYENGLLKNIQIVSDGENLLDNSNGKIPYYSDAYLKNEGTVLVIPAAKGHYLIGPNDSKKHRDIEVILTLEGLTDSDGISFTNTSYSFNYKINDTKDENDPSMDLWLARTEEDILNKTNLIDFYYSNFDKYTNPGGTHGMYPTYMRERHVNSIWIGLDANDDFSGVDYLEVQEQLIYYTSGKKCTDSKIYTKVTNPENNLISNADGENSFSGCFKYNFAGLQDGVVRLTFIIADRAGNKVSKTMDLIKDTDCSVLVSLSNTESRRMKAQTILVSDNPDEYEYIVPLKPSVSDNPYIYVNGEDKSDSMCQITTGNPSLVIPYNTKVIDFQYGYDLNHMISAELLPEYREDNGALGDYSWWKYDYSKYMYVNNDLKLFPKITVDPKKTVYTRTTLIDEAGNTRVCEDRILPSNYIASGYLEGDSIYFYLDHLAEGTKRLFCVYENEQGEKQKPCEQSNKDFKSISNSISSIEYYESGTNTTVSKSINNLSKGKYYFYVIVQGGSISGADGAFYSCGINPFIIEKTNSGLTFPGSNIASVASDDIPTEDQFTVTVTDGDRNTGKAHVKVEYVNFTPNPKLNYRVCYEDYYKVIGYDSTEKRGENCKGSSSELEFDVKSIKPISYSNGSPYNESKYIFWIEVYNQNSVKKSEEKSYDSPCTNNPPELNVNKNTSYYYVSPTEICFDIDVIKTDYYAYYTLPDGTTATPWYFFSNIPSLENTIDWNNDARVKRSVYMGSGYICKMDGGPYKYVYLYFKDEHGNTDEKCFRLYENYYNTKIECSKTTCNTRNTNEGETTCSEYNTVKLSVPKVEKAQLLARIEKINDDGNDWEDYFINGWRYAKYADRNNLSNLRRDFQSVYYDMIVDNSYDFILRKEQKTEGWVPWELPTWVKVCTWSYKDTAQGCDTGYYNTTYICIPYYTEDLSVTMKDLFYGARGITPWTDECYLMHTLVSDSNYGNNKNDWLNYAEEIKVQTGASYTETYTEPTDIPAGKYYTTIIHFADGDMEMTEVKQK